MTNREQIELLHDLDDRRRRLAKAIGVDVTEFCLHDLIEIAASKIEQCRSSCGCKFDGEP